MGREKNSKAGRRWLGQVAVVACAVALVVLIGALVGRDRGGPGGAETGAGDPGRGGAPVELTGDLAEGLSGRAEGFNVLLVTLDTVRADRFGCYGYAKAATPTLSISKAV